MYKNREDYARRVFGAETPELRAVREGLTDENDQIFIRPEEGRLLQFLVKLSGAKTIVEIGALGGYSALWMAGALPADGKITTLEKDERRADIARGNVAHDARIRLVAGDALETLPKLSAEGPFDMVFIDADKVNYLRYFEWAEQNTRRGGLIVVDNAFLFDAVWHDGPVDGVRDTARHAMREVNRRLADPEKYAGALIPSREGMSVGVKLF